MTDLSTPVPGWEFQLQHFSAEARQLQPEIVSMPANDDPSGFGVDLPLDAIGMKSISLFLPGFPASAATLPHGRCIECANAAGATTALKEQARKSIGSEKQLNRH